MEIKIREFEVADIPAARELWQVVEGIGLNESDTPDAITGFLNRNPGLSAVAISEEGRLVGAVLCGHDGRRGTLHHLAVDSAWRNRGIAKRLIAYCVDGMKSAGIPRCNLYLYNDNEAGTRFWEHNGWKIIDTWKILQKPL